MRPSPRTALRLLAATLLTASLLPFPGQAQQPAAAPSPDLAGIAHVALRVKSLDAAVAFYEKLGFVKAFALSRDGAVYEAFIKINDRQFIELYPADAKNTQIGFLHLCFEGANLQSAHDYYVAHGLKPNDVKTAGAGNLLFTMPGPATPTGPQNMEYTQYMPGSLHSKDFGQHLGPDRIATRLTAVTLATEDPKAAAAFYRDKVGFTTIESPNPMQSRFGLPGAPGLSVEIVPSQPLGYKARVSLAAIGFDKAEASLKQHGVEAYTVGTAHVVTDPDGNQLVLISPPAK